MTDVSRRRFSKRLLAAASLPLALISTEEANGQETGTAPTVPDIIAGYRLTDDEKRLVAKYLATHETNLSALRARDLPNSLSPSFITLSPMPKAENNRQKGSGRK